MKTIQLLVIVFSISCVSAIAQNVNYNKFKGDKIKTQIDTRLEEPYFRTYGSEFLERFIKITGFNSQSFINNPEFVLHQIYLASDKKTLKSHFSEDTKVKWKDYKSSFDAPILMEDSSVNFLLLKHKLTFWAGKDYLAIIKYEEYKDSVKIADRTIQIKGKEDHWIAVNQENFKDIQMVVQTITEAQFWSLNKRSALDENDSPIPEEVRQRVKDKDGTLNIHKLAVYITENGWDFK